MTIRLLTGKRGPSLLIGAVLAVSVSLMADVTAGQGGGRQGNGQNAPAQQGRGGRGGRGNANADPEANAPIDLTGQWVSVVTEDYRFRMVTPPRGDYSSVPLTPEGVKLADSWNLASDQASKAQCKAFGAAGLLRNPMRLRISWQDHTTLKLETDAGSQTRLFKFPAAKAVGEASFADPSLGAVDATLRAASAPPSLQGTSVATWETPRPGGGTLKVVTNNLLPGYLRKNGVPYGANTLLTEYFDRHTSFGTEWITVTTIVEDSQYLTQPFVTTTSFKKETATDKWRPSGCEYD